MIDILEEAKKLFLAGIGVAVMTYDKAIELIDQLVEKGKLTVEEGKELSQELKRNIKLKAENMKVSENSEEAKPATKDDIKQILKELNFVTKGEITELKSKIKELEDKLENKI